MRKPLTAVNEMLHLCLNNNQAHFIYLFWNRFCPASCRNTAAFYQTGTQVSSTSSWSEATGCMSATQRNSMLEVDCCCVGFLQVCVHVCVCDYLITERSRRWCRVSSWVQISAFTDQRMDSDVYNLRFLREIFFFSNQVKYIISKTVLFGYYAYLLKTAWFVSGWFGVFGVHWPSGFGWVRAIVVDPCAIVQLCSLDGWCGQSRSVLHCF